MIGQALGPAPLTADLGQPDAAAARLGATVAPAGNRLVAQRRQRAVDLRAMAAPLARHLDREAGARKVGEGTGRCHGHRVYSRREARKPARLAFIMLMRADAPIGVKLRRILTLRVRILLNLTPMGTAQIQR